MNKILIVTPQLKMHGGVSSYWAALIPELNKYVEIDNFQIGGYGKNQIGGYKKNILGPILDQWKFYKKLDDKIDLVFLNPSLSLKSFFREALLIKQVIKKNIPFVVFFHGWYVDFEKKIDKKYINFFLSTYGQAKIIFVLSNDFKNKILEWGYMGKIVVETTNVDVSLVSNFSSEKKITLIKNTNKIKILFLARLLRNKGIFETVSAFRNLSEKYNNLELTIAGDGKDVDELKSIIQDDYNIKYIGHVEGAEKVFLFTNSHIYCLPSYTEGLPTSILEAMAFALPVIATPVGGLKEFFQDTKMGYFVEPRNIKQIEEKLELLIADIDQVIKMGKYNYQYANEKLLSRVVAKRIHKNIEEALNE